MWFFVLKGLLWIGKTSLSKIWMLQFLDLRVQQKGLNLHTKRGRNIVLECCVGNPTSTTTCHVKICTENGTVRYYWIDLSTSRKIKDYLVFHIFQSRNAAFRVPESVSNFCWKYSIPVRTKECRSTTFLYGKNSWHFT